MHTQSSSPSLITLILSELRSDFNNALVSRFAIFSMCCRSWVKAVVCFFCLFLHQQCPLSVNFLSSVFALLWSDKDHLRCIFCHLQFALLIVLSICATWIDSRIAFQLLFPLIHIMTMKKKCTDPLFIRHFFHGVVVVAALYSFGWIVFNYNSRSSLLKKMMHNEKIAPIYPSFKFNYWRILRISPFTFGLDDIFQLVLPQIIFLALFLTNWKKRERVTAFKYGE